MDGLIMNFEDYFSEYENKHNCSPEKRECFEAGQQSQQDKIELLETELTETQAFLNNQNHIKQAKIDELQARIDKTDNLIMSFGNSIDIPLRNSLIDAIRGLEDL